MFGSLRASVVKFIGIWVTLSVLGIAFWVRGRIHHGHKQEGLRVLVSPAVSISPAGTGTCSAMSACRPHRTHS